MVSRSGPQVWLACAGLLLLSLHAGFWLRVPPRPVPPTKRILIQNDTPAPAVQRLVASLLIRIWPHDAFGMSLAHLRHWIAYLAFAGVSELRIYDHGGSSSNVSRLLFGEAPSPMRIHHMAWPVPAYPDAQRSAYEDSIRRANASDALLWLMHLDVDEYPFSPVDTERDFLLRYLAGLSPQIAQVVMRSLFFGGPSDLATQPDTPLPLQFNHRMPEAEPASQRTKYIARVRDIDDGWQSDIVHRLRMAYDAQDLVPDPDVLRVNHYWGRRLSKPLASLRWDSGLRIHHTV